ncbi:MarR family winged helix-turn-helix transcriptional regulator [Microvirga massiliensis]|uniref:MarR family winged helix-turn-helix transcriptional regulator n=1 Tax=Microvirga massiliensis TaxID=1033741 RepID=UPI00065F810B|nr:MarR family winged helix-turn-helix transcriptional regulator [Microvirga massiliensis]
MPINGNAAEHLYEGVREFRKQTGEKFSLVAFEVFLSVALAPAQTTELLAEESGLSLSGISRILASLGRVNRSGEPGMGLIEGVRDPQEPRRTIYFLTEKGRETVTELLRATQGISPKNVTLYPMVTAREFLDDWKPDPSRMRRKGRN